MTTLSEAATTRSTWWVDRFDTQVLIIGAGIAGLSATLKLPINYRIVVVTKGSLGESNTRYAQGGLATAIGLDDDPDLHFTDTMVAGAGLSDEGAVRVLVDGGPEAAHWLLEHGTQFDRDNDHLALGREAAHSRNRVLHAGGDATGAEIERSLVAQLRDRPSVTVLEHAIAIDLARNSDGSCGGAIVQLQGASGPTFIAASYTILANGGAGQLWGTTSNPLGATGDGAAMALRAGASVADLEFTQFHPTVLSVPGEAPFLLTEAIRGEGAWLRSSEGNRFMPDLHPLAELAPRDVVARASQDVINRQHGAPVYLDLRHLDPQLVNDRFPTIRARLASIGIDLARDLIPVAPAAHYFVGGVVASTRGETTVSGLYAIGEVACTGVHGANRLASNSLLEGLVFGLRLGEILPDLPVRPPDRQFEQGAPHALQSTVGNPSTRHAIQRVMNTNVAVEREASGLRQALTALTQIGDSPASAMDYALRSLYLLAHEVTESARFRHESRGSHFRLDYPNRRPDLDRCHQIVTMADAIWTREFGSLAFTLGTESSEGTRQHIPPFSI